VLQRHLANNGAAVSLARTLFYPRSLFQQPGRGRCACSEGEGAVGLDGDGTRDGQLGLEVRCARVAAIQRLFEL
jgi:hypothetical protein